MKKKMIYLASMLSLISTIFTGCGVAESPADTEQITTESNENNTSSKNNDELANHIAMKYADGPVPYFARIPLYYQQDYVDTVYKGSSTENNSLVTCLSMIVSFYESEYLTPNILMDNYGEQIKLLTSQTDIVNFISEKYSLYYEEVPLTIQALTSIVFEECYPVIIRIPHNSIFGIGSSCLIVSGGTEDGDFIVRDPNKDNLSSYYVTYKDDEPVYISDTVMSQASISATMYVLRQGAPEEPLEENSTGISVDNINDSDTSYNYITNPHFFSSYAVPKMPFHGINYLGDEVNNYLQSCGYFNKELQLTRIEKHGSYYYISIAFDDASSLLEVIFDETSDTYSFSLKTL